MQLLEDFFASRVPQQQQPSRQQHGRPDSLEEAQMAVLLPAAEPQQATLKEAELTCCQCHNPATLLLNNGHRVCGSCECGHTMWQNPLQHQQGPPPHQMPSAAGTHSKGDATPHPAAGTHATGAATNRPAGSSSDPAPYLANLGTPYVNPH